MTTKEQFLQEHNKLAPDKLQATLATLASFEADKPGLVKENDWSVARVRRPFIFWLTSQV